MGSALRKTCFLNPGNLKRQPHSPNNRIAGYDLARAVALLGMLLVNFSVLLGNSPSDSSWLDYLIEMIEGRAAATFVVLAGVGISLLTKRACLSKNKGAVNAERLLLLKRSLFLLIIGLSNFAISPISDILHFYAVYIAIGACLLTLSNWSLTLLALTTIIARPLVMSGLDFVQNWDFNPVAGADNWNLLKIIGYFLFNGCFPVIPWVAFLIIGMCIGRLDLSERSLSRKTLLLGCVAVVLAESVSRVGTNLSSAVQPGQGLEKLLPLFQIVSWDPMPLFVISTMGTALVVIGLIMIFADRYGCTHWISPFISVGQTTLTLYVAHIIFGIFLIRVIETLEMEPSLFRIWATILFYTGALLFSYCWMNRLGKGPLELLMRRFLVFSTPVKIPSPDMTKEKDLAILAG